MGHKLSIVTLWLLFACHEVTAQRRNRNSVTNYRDNNGWCEEARTRAIEALETCYGDEQCCRSSSQCANGCCGEDQFCHKDCFDSNGKNLVGTPISLLEYKRLLQRETCEKTITNVKDEDLAKLEQGVRIFSFLIWTICMIVGCCCCIVGKSRLDKVKNGIGEAKSKIKKRIQEMEANEFGQAGSLMQGIPMGTPGVPSLQNQFGY